MKTQAIVAGVDHIARLESVELPVLTDTRIRINTRFSGVSCGTEADCISGRAAYKKRPFITGYQAVGEVVEIGRLVRAVRVGDMVFTNGGGLWDQPHLAGGSHARELVVEDTNAFRLSPSNPSLQTSAYAALGAVGLNGISQMHPEAGRVLLVMGLGMLGQLTGKLAQLRGLRVIGANRSAWKLDTARSFGFDAVCAPEAAELEAAVKAISLGGIKYAVDLTGNQQIFNLALSQLEAFGELSLLGYYPDPFTVNFDTCHAKQLTIYNPVGLGGYLPEVIRWIENGRLNVEPLIHHHITPRGITDFYKDLLQNHSQYLGAVVDWQATN